MDEFAAGDTFRLPFPQEIHRKYKTPLESTEYTVGKTTDEPLKIQPIPREEGAVKFSIKTQKGKPDILDRLHGDARTCCLATSPSRPLAASPWRLFFISQCLCWENGFRMH